MSRSWVAKVRTHLRKVSSSGHSHAVSMCAWPIAVISCVRVALRRSFSSGREDRAGRGHVARSSASHALQKRLSSRSSSPRQASSTPGSSISAASTSRSRDERPRLAVEARELAALQAERRGGTRPPRGAAGCSSDHPKSPLQAISTLALSGSPAAARSASIASGADVRAPADQPLDRLAVEPQRGLGVGDEQQVDLLAVPLLGHARLAPRATTSPTAGPAPSPASRRGTRARPPRRPRCGRPAPRSACGRAPARRRARAPWRGARPGARARACSPGGRAGAGC